MLGDNKAEGKHASTEFSHFQPAMLLERRGDRAHDIYVNYGYIEPSRMMRFARFKGYRRCSAVLYLFSFPVETMVAVLLVKN